MKPSAAWFLACRPKTLTVSLSPVLVGTALAAHDGGYVLWLPFLAAALGAGLIQIGTNLFNDVGDYWRGVDAPDRLGPPRATAQGWLSPRAVQGGAWLAFALAFVCGVYLVIHGGWPIVAIGLASLIAGWAYTGGPKPIACGPLGEWFVLVFFGFVAAGGSYYLQTLTLMPAALLAGAIVGLQAAAVITVNNYRDMATDARGGRRTLAVCLGAAATRRLYAGEVFLPYGLVFLFWPQLGLLAGLPCLTLPLAVILAERFFRQPPGPAFNALLAGTARLQLAFSLLLCLAFVMY